MSKFRHIVRAAMIGATALLLGGSPSAAGQYWRPSVTPEQYRHPSVTPEQVVTEATNITTRHAAPSTIARMRARAAYGNVARPPTATSKDHRLILQVNTNDPAAMNLALNNAMNVTQYYKDRGEKVKIEVITFGPGLNMLREDTSPVKARIETMALSTPEVSYKACGNTQENMRQAENKDIPLIPQAQVVKSGVVRVMELQEKGWTYVKP
jgi:intracellular sulfur oxidation DsrE/DsrF family protein